MKALHEWAQPDKGAGILFFDPGQPDFDKIKIKDGTGRCEFDEKSSLLPGYQVHLLFQTCSRIFMTK